MKEREKIYYHALCEGLCFALEAGGLGSDDFWKAWGSEGQEIRAFGEMLSPDILKILGAAKRYADGPLSEETKVLLSPFALLSRHDSDLQWILPRELQLEEAVLFPVGEASGPFEKRDLLLAFLGEWKALSVDRQGDLGGLLLPLMEKHLSSYAAGPPGVSLFEHSRVAAALALCFFDEGMRVQAMLVKGDLSGIQDFIFRVNSKGASKALKARSAEVLFQSELIVSRLSRKMDLLPAQVLYIGGGNFYFLTAPGKKKLLLEEYEKIKGELLQHELQLYLGHAELGPEDLAEIGAAWIRVEKSLQNSRMKPAEGIAFGQVFGDPVEALAADNKAWQNKAAKYKNAIGFQPGFQKEGYTDLGEGYSIQLRFSPERRSLAYNLLDLQAGWGGFRFVANRLPLWEKEQLEAYEAWEARNLPEERSKRAADEDAAEREEGNIIDFQALAGFSARDGASRHLGILKLDVDNLGRLFREGLPKEYRTLTRTAALSRTLKWFFAGYLDELTRKEPWKGLLYIIFSGGDDFFLAGPWHLVFEFAGVVRDEFARLVGYAQAVTLSASLLLLRPGYPVNRFSELSENALELAKSGEKDQINLFGETLTWRDYRQAVVIRDDLIHLIESGKTSKAILNKLRRSATGFESLRREPGEVLLRFPKLWRLRYYLRDAALGASKVEKEANKKEIESKIIEPYEKLVAKNFTEGNQRDHHPILFTVAARWAEFSIRNQEKNVKKL